MLKAVLKSNLPLFITKNVYLGKSYSGVRDIYRSVKHYLKPPRTARVYVKKGLSRMIFFQTLNEREIEYVLLRWWHDMPKMPVGEDMDILIKDEDRGKIDDLLTNKDYGTDLKCDIYTVTGSQNGSHKGLPYFQFNLANSLLETRRLFRGVFVPDATQYFASLAYHAIFHKGAKSGLSGFSGDIIEHDYHSILSMEANKLKLKLDITANGLFDWLKRHNYIPADDTLSKLVEIKPELALFQNALYSDARGGDVITYLVREQLYVDGLLKYFLEFLEKEYHFDVIDIRVLSIDEIDICSTQIRGGKWDKGPYRLSGGKPVVMMTVFDHNPCPLEGYELQKQPRTTNRNGMYAKYGFRDKINQIGSKSHYNGLHSSDNEQDAWTYIKLLGDKYYNEIYQKIEFMRGKRGKSRNHRID